MMAGEGDAWMNGEKGIAHLLNFLDIKNEHRETLLTGNAN